jgi:hypothetical protein
VAWEIDIIIERAISKNKSLYKIAEREIKEKFLKVDWEANGP